MLDQLPSPPGKLITLALGVSPFDEKVLTFGVTQLPESRREKHGEDAPVRGARRRARV
jgi:hypothetical protein